MKYCPDCGAGHDCTGASSSEVEIMRLQTNRDIEVARINASAAKVIAETEAEHSSQHAEGLAEGMETAIDALTGTDEPEPAEGEPIIVETADEPEPEPEVIEPDNAPPVVEVREPASAKRGGYWGMYH